MIDADRIFVALNIFGVSQTIALDILNVLWLDRAYYWTFSKTKYYIVYGNMFFIASFLSSRRL